MAPAAALNERSRLAGAPGATVPRRPGTPSRCKPAVRARRRRRATPASSESGPRRLEAIDSRPPPHGSSARVSRASLGGRSYVGCSASWSVRANRVSAPPHRCTNCRDMPDRCQVRRLRPHVAQHDAPATIHRCRDREGIAAASADRKKARRVVHVRACGVGACSGLPPNPAVRIRQVDPRPLTDAFVGNGRAPRAVAFRYREELADNVARTVTALARTRCANAERSRGAEPRRMVRSPHQGVRRCPPPTWPRASAAATRLRRCPDAPFRIAPTCMLTLGMQRRGAPCFAASSAGARCSSQVRPADHDQLQRPSLAGGGARHGAGAWLGGWPPHAIAEARAAARDESLEQRAAGERPRTCTEPCSTRVYACCTSARRQRH